MLSHANDLSFNYQHFADYHLSKEKIREAVAYAALVAIHGNDLFHFTQNLSRLKNYQADVLKQKIVEVTSKCKTLHSTFTEDEKIVLELKTFIENISKQDIFPKNAEHIDIFLGIFKKLNLEYLFSTLEQCVDEETISFVLNTTKYALTISYCKNSTPHWTFVNPDQSSVQMFDAKELPEKICESMISNQSAKCVLEMYCNKENYALIIQKTKQWREQAEDLTKFLPTEPSELGSELFSAIRGRNTYRVKQLLAAKADPNIQDEQKNTPVMTAVLLNQCEILQSLIDHKAETKTDNEKRPALLTAAINKNKDTMLALLKADADPNSKFNDITPLFYTVYDEQPDLVNLLLEYKANPDQQFSSGTTLFSYAQKKHNKVIEDALDKAGASHIPDRQDFFLDRMNKTGLRRHNGRGTCFGLVCEATQDYFDEGLQKLTGQVETIARTPIDEFKPFASIIKKNRKEWLQRALAEVCDVWTKQTGLTLTSDKLWLNKLSLAEIKILLNITEELDEKTLHQQFNQFLIKNVYKKIREYRETEIKTHPEMEIPYLFEEVDAYHIATSYFEFYPKGFFVEMQNFLQGLPLFASMTLDPENIAQADCINGIYTKRELEFYFTSLSDAFKTYPGKIAFQLGNFHHFIALFPSPKGTIEWHLFNPDHMPVCKVSSKELAKYVLSSFCSEQVVFIHLEIYVNRKDLNIAKECIQQWKSHPSWQAMQTITPQKAQMVDEFKCSFLQFAVIYNELLLSKILLEMKADPDYADEKGNTALRIAAQNGNVELIKLLQSHGASLEPTTDQGDTPLHIAAQVGQLEAVRYLLKEKVDVNCKTNVGTTALIIASKHAHIEVVRILTDAENGHADLQSRPFATNSHIFWNRVPSTDPTDIILTYSENTTIEVRNEIERVLGKY